MIRPLRILALAALSASPVLGAPVFDNGTYFQPPFPPGTAGGYASDVSFPPTGQIIADDFTLSLDSTIQSITFYGGFAGAGTPPPTPQQFGIIFWNDSGSNLPGTQIQGELLALTPVATGDFIGATQVFNYTTAITPLSLLAGTQYWFTAVYFNAPADPDDNFFWVTTTTGNGNPGAVSTTGGTSWAQIGNTFNDRELVFSLVPEPASLTLMGLGICAVAWRRRRALAAA